MSITFVFANNKCMQIGEDTQLATDLQWYAIYMGYLKKLERYGLSSDKLKNTIEYHHNNIFKDTLYNCIGISNIQEFKQLVSDYVIEFNRDEVYVIDLVDIHKDILNGIEPDVKRQYIIAKVNELRELNIPDPPVDISNDPVE